MLPGDGDFDVDAEQSGEHGGGEFGGQAEQCGGAALRSGEVMQPRPCGRGCSSEQEAVRQASSQDS